MKQLCMYCNMLLSEVDGPADRISHGLCPNCFPKFVKGSGQTIDEFLESLPAPVFLMNEKICILETNQLGRDLLKENHAQLKNKMGGEVFQCKYLRNGTVCGETLHCRTCTIRLSVEHTFQTGEPCVKVPAYIDFGDVLDERKIKYLISTKKMDDLILLQIENTTASDA